MEYHQLRLNETRPCAYVMSCKLSVQQYDLLEAPDVPQHATTLPPPRYEATRRDFGTVRIADSPKIREGSYRQARRTGPPHPVQTLIQAPDPLLDPEEARAVQPVRPAVGSDFISGFRRAGVRGGRLVGRSGKQSRFLGTSRMPKVSRTRQSEPKYPLQPLEFSNSDRVFDAR